LAATGWITPVMWQPPLQMSLHFFLMINKTLPAKYAAMKMMDIKNYYLGTTFPWYE
jgi:hypothetical protein